MLCICSDDSSWHRIVLQRKHNYPQLPTREMHALVMGHWCMIIAAASHWSLKLPCHDVHLFRWLIPWHRIVFQRKYNQQLCHQEKMHGLTMSHFCEVKRMAINKLRRVITCWLCSTFGGDLLLTILEKHHSFHSNMLLLMTGEISFLPKWLADVFFAAFWLQVW